MFRGGATASGNAAITGGSISGVTGAVTVLYQGGIPVIGPGSFTMNNNGAFVLGTALAVVNPDAYVYFLAGDIAAGVPAAAGWYYCTFSSTTAGTAFNNTWTTGVPTIPASPTAFATTGPGARTGDTGEEFAMSIAVPVLGVNSKLRMTTALECNATANAKNLRARLSGTGGTAFFVNNSASLNRSGFIGEIANTGSVSKQLAYGVAVSAIGAVAPVLGTVNTGVATTLVLSLQRATATDNLVLLPPTVELML